MDPEHRNLAMVVFRNPDAGEWTGFHSKALLIGAASEAPHYNCFPRLPLVLFGRIFGSPLNGYFDYFGALVPSQLAPVDLRTFGRFCEIVGTQLRSTKTECANFLVLIEIKGTSPKPPNGAILHIELPIPKLSLWSP